jgi:hypothetical protein
MLTTESTEGTEESNPRAADEPSTGLAYHGRHMPGFFLALVAVLWPVMFELPRKGPLRLTCGADSTIRATTTREDLVRIFGARNVKDTDVYVGEGFSEPGTLLFPGDRNKEIGIIWREEAGKKYPDTARTFVHFEARASNHLEEVTPRATEWRGPADITIGTSLTMVERVNRKPFRLAGFGWDGSGTVVSWEGGTLASEGTGCYFMLRFTPKENLSGKTKPVTGSSVYSSGHPVMQKVNPTVYQMMLSFNRYPRTTKR